MKGEANDIVFQGVFKIPEGVEKYQVHMFKNGDWSPRVPARPGMSAENSASTADSDTKPDTAPTPTLETDDEEARRYFEVIPVEKADASAATTTAATATSPRLRAFYGRWLTATSGPRVEENVRRWQQKVDQHKCKNKCSEGGVIWR